ncbi:MAG: RNA-binding transcriptional accessory protein [Hyphomonadaceae bacterium]|nr:RNA-binding transcriptional accessory protein [Clostridia bacterium]
MDKILQKLQQEFSLKATQVENTVTLIDEGNTIPFIARYRKELTGEMNDQVLRELNDRLLYLRGLEARKLEITRMIDEQGKLTQALSTAIARAEIMSELEDIYRPYRPKRRTRAMIAKEKGLEPLAEMLFAQNIFNGTLDVLVTPFINEAVPTIEEALAGCMDIIAEWVSDNADYRKNIRQLTFQHGILASKAKKVSDSVYAMYNDYHEALLKIPGHRILAIDRGEKEEILSVSIDIDEQILLNYLHAQVLMAKACISTQIVVQAIGDSYKRLIAPSIANEIRNALTEKAQEQAMKVFSENLKNLLLQPPVHGKVVLAVDPAYRTGCKIAVIDDTGKVFATTVIYPTPPVNKVEEAKVKIKDLIEKYKVEIIAIGNGTASKESEIFIADLISELDREVYYMVVSESGASVYSASKLAAEEFPQFDVSLRSAVSIGRRLQDPLAELVKIDPKAIGVGQYQHDMNQKRLGENLGGVVEDCVNRVGVDLNTASPSLLSYVSGINGTIAKNIVVFREENGKYENRKQLLKVQKLGKKVYEQCAGFLRIPEGKNILDNTSVHPESYEAAQRLLDTLGYSLTQVKQGQLSDLREKVSEIGREKLAALIGVGVPTLSDIITEILRPGRDPRDELPKPQLMRNVLDMGDLTQGMVLNGTVRNVVDFGAFVDIGVHQDGLVHISQISDKFIKHPMDMLSVGDLVKVKILDIDAQKKRISLTMKEI